MSDASRLQPITRAEVEAEMKRIGTDDGDPESSHGEADDLLCRIAATAGYPDVVQWFGTLKKWYA